LRSAVAGLVLEGRLVKGSRGLLDNAWHTWALLAEWPWSLPLAPGIEFAPGQGGYPEPGPPPEDPKTWLTQRLETLGLEHDEEIALLEPADLVPDVAKLFGLPQYLVDGL